MLHLPLNNDVGRTVGALIFCTLLVLAAAVDIRSRRIPNAIVLTLAVCGIIASGLGLGVGSGSVWGSLKGLGVGLLIWLPLFAVGGLGAGDVKLFAAAAAWLGPERAAVAALVSALLGGVLALLWLVSKDGVVGTAARFAAMWSAPRRISVDPRSSGAIPYGVALAGGALWVAWFPHVLVFRG